MRRIIKYQTIDKKWHEVEVLDLVDSFSEKKSVPLPSRASKKEFPEDSIPYKLADILFWRVVKRRNVYARFLDNPEAVKILLQNQAYSFDLLLRKDGKGIEEVLDVLDWALEDEFWRDNVLSAATFREKYSTLLSQMKTGYSGNQLEDSNPALTQKIIGVYRALISNSSYKPSTEKLQKFVEARKRMEAFFKDSDIDQSYWTEYLLSCLEKNFVNQGKIVYPGNLSSEFTWDVLLPQYMAEIGLEV